MHSLLLLTAVACGLDRLPDATVIYLENSNAIVERYTGSEISHVALAVNDGVTTWVYEATPREVRRLSWSSYVDELARLNDGRRRPIKAFVMKPKRLLTQDQRERLVSYLDSQIGRRYSVKSYVRHMPSDGIHCAEYVANALMSANQLNADRSYRLNPAALVGQLRGDYQTASAVSVPDYEPQGSWCERSWAAWFRFREWCSWACIETWTFCW